MDAAIVHRRRWAILATLCLSLMIIGLDNREGYVQAMDNTVLVAAAVAFAGALVALRWMPRRTALDPAPSVTTNEVAPSAVEMATSS